MTDNGPGDISDDFRAACGALGAPSAHPALHARTNGKAKRVIQTLLREWAYHQPYRSSAAHQAWFARWVHRYNLHRPHTSLGGLPPFARISWGNNLVRVHSLVRLPRSSSRP